MVSNEENIAAHLAALERFRNDPAYDLYWKNWKRCQNWMNKCNETYEDHEKKAAWDKAQEDIDFLMKSMESGVDTLPTVKHEYNEPQDEDIVMEENAEMSEFYRISMEHRKERKVFSIEEYILIIVGFQEKLKENDS